MSLDWTALLSDQLDWHWQHHLRPRLDGLTDEEYLWEPVSGCWSIRSRSSATTSAADGAGDLVLDYDPDVPVAPVTTVAWRLAHLIRGVFAARNESHFGGPPAGYRTFAYARTANHALAQLDEAYARWMQGVRGLDASGLARPCGPAEGPYAEAPMAELVLHIHREALHHGAEVALLRDLYRWRRGGELALS